MIKIEIYKILDEWSCKGKIKEDDFDELSKEIEDFILECWMKHK